jgi:hypothetical protein
MNDFRHLRQDQLFGWPLSRAQRGNPSSPAYFLGSIVMSSGKPIEVIDGQQRLATTAIIFAGIRDALHKRGCEDEAQSVHSDFLVRRPALNEGGQGVLPRLTLNKQDKGYFWNEIIRPFWEVGWTPQQPMRDSHLAIRAAKGAVCSWFDLELTKADNKSDVLGICSRWVDQLVDHVVVAAITAINRREAFRLFATLNDRGIRVGQADLVKSFLFEMAATSDDHRESFDIIESAWSSTRTTLDAIKEEDIVVDYLRHFLQLRHGVVREDDIYTKVENDVASESAAVSFAESLSATAVDYAAVASGSHPFWKNGDGIDRAKHRRIVNDLNLKLKLRYHRVLLLACCSKFTPTELLKTLEFIQSLSVRLLCCGGMRSGKTESALANVAKDVFAGKFSTAAELKGNLNPITPIDAQFKSAFAIKKVSDNLEARYLMIAIENYLRKAAGEGLEVSEDTNVTNLEHILPKGKITSQNTENWSHFTAESKRDYCVRLGNMALALNRENSEDDQKSFSDKRSGVLAKGSFSTNKWFDANTTASDLWDESQIESRQAWLASEATKVWPI